MHRSLSLLLIVCALLAACTRAMDPLQKQSEEFFPLPLDGAIDLENSDGSIHIYGWYEPRVRLAALRRAYTETRLRQIRIETKAQPAALAVRTVIPRPSGVFADRSGTVDYTLNVPESSHLQLQLRNGVITLDGLRGGSANIRLTNGRVTALNCFARVQARARAGVLEVFYQWWENLPASFDYALGQGRIAALLPAAARFQADAQTTNGRIHNDFHLSLVDAGSGQRLTGATAQNPTMSLRLGTGGGNISIDQVR